MVFSFGHFLGFQKIAMAMFLIFLVQIKWGTSSFSTCESKKKKLSLPSELFKMGNSARSQNMILMEHEAEIFKNSAFYQAALVWNSLNPKAKQSDHGKRVWVRPWLELHQWTTYLLIIFIRWTDFSPQGFFHPLGFCIFL